METRNERYISFQEIRIEFITIYYYYYYYYYTKERDDYTICLEFSLC